MISGIRFPMHVVAPIVARALRRAALAAGLVGALVRPLAAPPGAGPIDWERPAPAAAKAAVEAIKLTPEEEERAQRLHAESLVIVAHSHDFLAADFADAHTGGITAVVLKLITDSIDWNRDTRTRYPVPGLEGWTERFLGYLGDIRQIADNPENKVRVIETVDDIFAAKAAGEVGAIIGSEGAMHLEGELANVERFHSLGWRETQLRWAANQLLDGSSLSEFGRQVIAECNRLGVLIDISHLYGSEVPAVMANTEDPVVRSHDAPAHMGGEASDALIQLVANSGGGNGVFCVHFGYLQPLTKVLDAIDYIVNLVGVDHVGIGADWYPETGTTFALDAEEMLELTRGLVERGYSDEEIEKILGLNLVRLYRIVWGEETEEERAERLHNSSIIILAHDHTFTAGDFDAAREAGLTAKVLKLTTDGIDWENGQRYEVTSYEGWRERHLGYLEGVQALADNPEANVTIIRTVEDLYQAKVEGKIGAIIGSEGVRYLEGELEALEEFHALGTREIQLWWPAGNQAIVNGQLTAFGRALIAECNRLGIVIDVSHMGGLALDVIALSEDPVIVSHDTPSTIGGEASDALIQAVAASGGGHGVFAIHFINGYVTPPTVARVAYAIDYVRDLVGIEHVALGGDYFPEDGVIWAIPVSELKELTLELVRRGYSDTEIRQVLGLNLIRLYERVWNKTAGGEAADEQPIVAGIAGQELLVYEVREGGIDPAQPAASVTLASQAIDVAVTQLAPGGEPEIVVLRQGTPDQLSVYRRAGGELELIAEGSVLASDAIAVGAAAPRQGTATPAIGVLIDNGTAADTFSIFELNGDAIERSEGPRVFAQVGQWDYRGEYSGFALGQIVHTGGAPPLGGDPNKLNAAFGTIWPDGRNIIHYAEVGSSHLAPVYLTAGWGGAASVDFGLFFKVGAPGDHIVGGGGHNLANRVAWWEVPQGVGGAWEVARDVGAAVVDVAAVQLDGDTEDEIVYLTAGTVGWIDPGSSGAGGTAANLPGLVRIDGTRVGEGAPIIRTPAGHWTIWR